MFAYVQIVLINLRSQARFSLSPKVTFAHLYNFISFHFYFYVLLYIVPFTFLHIRNTEELETAHKFSVMKTEHSLFYKLMLNTNKVIMTYKNSWFFKVHVLCTQEWRPTFLITTSNNGSFQIWWSLSSSINPRPPKSNKSRSSHAHPVPSVILMSIANLRRARKWDSILLVQWVTSPFPPHSFFFPN